MGLPSLLPSGPGALPQLPRPQPVDCAVMVSAEPFPNDPKVAITIHSPTGVAVYFIPPDAITELCAALQEAARMARSGLVVAKGL